MAKKKVSHSNQEKTSKKQQDFVKPNNQQDAAAAMDSEATEKLDSLKSLNQMLLKEAIERRQQVDSLLQSKGSLESELTRSNSERDSLSSELIHLGEKAVALELEKSVVAVFVGVQMDRNGELVEQKIEGLEKEVRDLKRVVDGKESEIGTLNGKIVEIEGALGNEKEVSRRVSIERDGLNDRLDLLVAESKGLRANLIELEESKREMERAIGELRVAYDGVVTEKEEKEKKIESMMRENDSLQKGLVELEKVFSETTEQLREALKEKEGIEMEKNTEIVKRVELEKLVSGLNDTVSSLQKEAEKMRVNLVELESKCVENEETRKEMTTEIDNLMEEKKFSEKRVEGLIDEKNVVEKNLGEAMNQLDKERHKIEDLVNEKSVLMEARGILENEVVSLQNQEAKLKAFISKLEESGNLKEEKILGLESVVGDYKRKLELVKVERDEIRVCLDEEKQNAVKLNEQIENMEKKIEEILEIAYVVKTENGALSSQKVELQGHCENLKKEIVSLEAALTEAQNELGSMKGKFESADAKSELVLSMLKNTAAFCSADENNISKQINGEEVMPSVIEFEMIKNAFKSKEAKIDSMKKQLEFLQNSVDEVNKKKSFWTVLSSATTLLAAVSLAYVARGAGR